MASVIDCLNFGGTAYPFTLPYGVCSTAIGTSAKTVTLSNFSLETGARISVKFTYGNSSGLPTLNVNSTGAKYIYSTNGSSSTPIIPPNTIVDFVYTGTAWEMISAPAWGNIISSSSSSSTKMYLIGSFSNSNFTIQSNTVDPNFYIKSSTLYGDSIESSNYIKVSNSDGTRAITLKPSSSSADIMYSTDVGSTSILNISNSYTSPIVNFNGITLQRNVNRYLQGSSYSCTTMNSTLHVSSQLTFYGTSTTGYSAKINQCGDLYWYYGTTLTGSLTASSSNMSLSGTWKINGAAVTSDRRLKNSISNMTIKYETLFDNLNPITYKYNDGTSDRIHTGFIAQDVESAIETADLTTQDFAAFVRFPKTEDDKQQEGDNGLDDELALRYEEFISLNTWQIQKLKKRVAELEEIVAELKQ